jgi:hypothetical protein
MNIQIGFTDELTNTFYAPLVALFAHYQHNHLFEPLQSVRIPMRKRDFEPQEKLIQVLLSILAGCETLFEVNPRLKHEQVLAQGLGMSRLLDQSSLSRTLDALTLKNIDEFRSSTQQIWRPLSQVTARDWRSYLWLDFDLSGLPCGPLAESSQKGYFAGKKTSVAGSWPVSAPSLREKRSGQVSIQVIPTPSSASNRPCLPAKLL